MSDVASDTPGTCPVGKFPAVTDFSKVGPYMAAPSEAGGSTCTVFRPTVLGEGGVKHPVVIWGNGTGGNPGVYTWLLAHWATHGFVVVAANTASAGTGAEMVACLDWIEGQNSASGSIYNGKIALSRAAASGHSQGGGGTLMAGRDARFLTTVPFMAYTQQGFGGFDQASIPQQKGAMLLMSGSADTIAAPAANQQPVFMNTNVPVLWGTLTGADHVTFALGLTLGGGGAAVVGYLGPSTAWLRLHLMCDESARPIFYGTPACTLCQNAQWTVQRKGIN